VKIFLVARAENIPTAGGVEAERDRRASSFAFAFVLMLLAS
jgi:hypothetical protein